MRDVKAEATTQSWQKLLFSLFQALVVEVLEGSASEKGFHPESLDSFCQKVAARCGTKAHGEDGWTTWLTMSSPIAVSPTLLGVVKPNSSVGCIIPYSGCDFASLHSRLHIAHILMWMETLENLWIGKLGGNIRTGKSRGLGKINSTSNYSHQKIIKGTHCSHNHFC